MFPCCRAKPISVFDDPHAFDVPASLPPPQMRKTVFTPQLENRDEVLSQGMRSVEQQNAIQIANQTRNRRVMTIVALVFITLSLLAFFDKIPLEVMTYSHMIVTAIVAVAGLAGLCGGQAKAKYIAALVLLILVSSGIFYLNLQAQCSSVRFFSSPIDLQWVVGANVLFSLIQLGMVAKSACKPNP